MCVADAQKAQTQSLCFFSIEVGDEGGGHLCAQLTCGLF